jgi:hypothetical protein
MTIKRLDLASWMYPHKLGFADTIRRGPYTAIEPKLNVNGWFIQAGECWFEVDGKAYSCPRDMFDYNMTILNVRELSQFEVSALKQVVDAKIATQAQIKLYALHKQHGNKFNPHTARRKKMMRDLMRK